MGEVRCVFAKVIDDQPNAGDLLFDDRAAVRVERVAANSFVVKHHCRTPESVLRLAANEATALVDEALRKQGYQAIQQGLHE